MRRNQKKMLITGVSGLLGSNLAYHFKDKYRVLGLYNSHPVAINGIKTKKADVTSRASFDEIIADFNPDTVIHCAALADIDFCQTNKELADRINIYGTRIVTDSIKKRDAKLIYISTDSVYDGIKGDFSENDDINPLNYYGLSKYKGEKEAITKRNSLILRTNLFGWNIQNKYSLAEWIVNELFNNRSINGFTDALFSTLYTFELAKIIDMLIDRDIVGLYNCGSSSSLSKYEFGVQIAEYFNLDKCLITPTSIDEFNFKAKRGKNFTLNVNKLVKDLNYTPPDVTYSIKRFYMDFRKGVQKKLKTF